MPRTCNAHACDGHASSDTRSRGAPSLSFLGGHVVWQLCYECLVGQRLTARPGRGDVSSGRESPGQCGSYRLAPGGPRPRTSPAAAGAPARQPPSRQLRADGDSNCTANKRTGVVFVPLSPPAGRPAAASSPGKAASAELAVAPALAAVLGRIHLVHPCQQRLWRATKCLPPWQCSQTLSGYRRRTA
jgi:hypothetical protein